MTCLSHKLEGLFRLGTDLAQKILLYIRCIQLHKLPVILALRLDGHKLGFGHIIAGPDLLHICCH